MKAALTELLKSNLKKATSIEDLAERLLSEGVTVRGYSGKTIKALNIREYPAVDAVEVIRCIDCSYCRYNQASDIYKCDRRGYYSEQVAPTDYCSHGSKY